MAERLNYLTDPASAAFYDSAGDRQVHSATAWSQLYATRAVMVLGTAIFCWVAAAGAADALIPEFKQIELVVRQSLRVESDYQAGDLLSRRSAATALEAVAAAGWQVPGSGDLLQRVLPDDSFLVRDLSTERGHELMRRIAHYPDAYQRVDTRNTSPKHSTGRIYTTDDLIAALKTIYRATSP